jgi:hypothetical protein
LRIAILPAACVLALASTSGCGGARAAHGASAAVVAHPRTRDAKTLGDYDRDDLFHDARFDDADNDDPSGNGGTVREDGDNDVDGRPGRLYDGDDDAVRHFGRLASPADARAIATLVKRYYSFAALDDGAGVCSLMVKTMADTVAEDLGQPPGPPQLRGHTCAIVMGKVFRHNRSLLGVYETDLQIIRAGVEGNRALVVLGFGKLPARQIVAVRDRGEWRLAARVDSEMP